MSFHEVCYTVSLEETSGTTKPFSQNNVSPGRGSTLLGPEYEERMLTFQTQHSLEVPAFK
jgi:hypothetical protein